MELILLLGSLVGTLLACLYWYASRAPAQRKRPEHGEACWFYQNGKGEGEKIGPVLAHEIVERIRRGELPRDVLLWGMRLTEWTPAEEVDAIRYVLPREGYQSSNNHKGDHKGDHKGEVDFQQALVTFAHDLGYQAEDVLERMRLEDHTGRSCVVVLSRRLDVSTEEVRRWAQIS